MTAAIVVFSQSQQSIGRRVGRVRRPWMCDSRTACEADADREKKNSHHLTRGNYTDLHSCLSGIVALSSPARGRILHAVNATTAGRRPSLTAWLDHLRHAGLIAVRG